MEQGYGTVSLKAICDFDFGELRRRVWQRRLANEEKYYVQWLSQHPSGARFRGEIARVQTVLGRASRLWPQLG